MGGISYQKLAAKHDVNISTLTKRAVREKWQAMKKSVAAEVEVKVTEKLKQKLANAKTDKIMASLDVEIEAAELISNLILNTLKSDPKQFKRHLVTQKVKGYEVVDLDNGAIGTDNITVKGIASGPPQKSNKKLATVEHQITIEKEFSVVDTKRLASLAIALEKSSAIRKEILGIIDASTKEKLAIEREKLDLAKEIANRDRSDENEVYEIIDPFAEVNDDQN